MLRDMGMLSVDEPFKRLLTQGMVLANGTDPRTGKTRMFKMSKSIGNVIDPSDIIAMYGADVARCFILFQAPPDKDLEWSETGVEGIARFLNRMWRFVQTNLDLLRRGLAPAGEVTRAELTESDDLELLRLVHDVTRRVSNDLGERYQFNTAISACMELLNGLSGYTPREGDALGERLLAMGTRRLLLLISPCAPHLAEELWAQLGLEGLAAAQRWPEWDASALKVEEVEIVIQVLGKVRGRLVVGVQEPEDSIRARALNDEKIKTLLEGRTIRKIIYVPNKLMNIVAD